MNIIRVSIAMLWILCIFACLEPAQSSDTRILNPHDFRFHIDDFNSMEPEHVVNFIPNEKSWTWLQKNIPFFACPDTGFQEIYYFRWWTLRKHIKNTPDGFVFTEFITPVKHAGIYNTISCALGHHIMESRWLENQNYLKETIAFWLRGHNAGSQPHFHNFSNWLAFSMYQKYLVDGDKEFMLEFLPELVRDFEQWEQERLLSNGMFWQHDVKDGMEESISGSRKHKNARPTINSYMYANALAISEMAKLAGNNDLAKTFSAKAHTIKNLVQTRLWDKRAQFFKVRFENGQLSDAREQIGFIPWYFNLPDSDFSAAWQQLLDPEGFSAPFGITTAERRHPQFRSHGVGTCEWDGAVWPFATSQTLTGLANLLNNYHQNSISRKDYFDALTTYARAHHKNGKPYIGEYQDEITGEWLKGDNPRSRYYNHSTFCDLVITGLVGLRPRPDRILKVNPLLPQNSWDWFALDRVHYHGKLVSIVWDKTGKKFGMDKGLSIYVDGTRVAQSPELAELRVPLFD